jgi:hypothetical protein
MIKNIFELVAIYGLFSLFFSRRRFDFVSSGYLGMLVYFSPGFYGFVLNPWFPSREPEVPIETTVYVIWIFALTTTIIAGKLYRGPPVCEERNFTTDWAIDTAIIGMIVGSFVLMMFTSGPQLLSTNKQEVLESTNRFFILFSSATQLGLVLFVLQRKWLRALVPAAGVAFLLYIGFRSDLALAAVALFTVTANRRGLRSVLNVRSVLIAAAIAMILLAYKPVLYAYQSGDVGLAVSLLGQPDFILQSITRSEPFLTQAVLNQIVAQNYSADINSFLFAIIALVPFLLPLIGVPNEQAMFSFQDTLFPNLSYGVASNIYGHFYAVMGAAGVVLFVVLHNLALVGLSSRLSRGNPTAFSATIMIGSYFAFYVHRNDLVFSATTISRIFVTVAMMWGIAQLLRGGVSYESQRASRDVASERPRSRPSKT